MRYITRGNKKKIGLTVPFSKMKFEDRSLKNVHASFVWHIWKMSITFDLIQTFARIWRYILTWNINIIEVLWNETFFTWAKIHLLCKKMILYFYMYKWKFNLIKHFGIILLYLLTIGTSHHISGRAIWD